MSSSAFRNPGARRAAIRHRLGRIASFAVALATLSLAWQPPQAAADSIKVQISNFPTWKEVQGVEGIPQSPPGFFGLTYAERMQIVSRPYVRIDNVSSSQSSSSFQVLGFQMDMANWNAKVAAVDWVSTPTDGFKGSWNWNEASQSAFFQFGDNPLTPGQALVMRLSTAPKTGQEAYYHANQTLFSPSSTSCLENNTGGVCFNMFTRPIGLSANAVTYDASGKPTSSGVVTTEVCTENISVSFREQTDPNSVNLEAVVPVPEPGTVVMAASAAAVLALACLRRRRT